MLKQLINLFIKQTGRKPNAIELLQENKNKINFQIQRFLYKYPIHICLSILMCL